jgi:hypothetical protein
MPGMQDVEIQICQELITELQQMQFRYSQPATLLADHRSEDVREAAKIWARKAERIGQLIAVAANVWPNADNAETAGYDAPTIELGV